MSHTHGVGARAVHELAWDCFLAATGIVDTLEALDKEFYLRNKCA